MNDLKLLLVNTDYKRQYLDMVEECKEDIVNCGFELYIPISNNSTFEIDIKKLIDMHRGIGLPEGWVPASIYWMVNDFDQIIGVIVIRHYLSEYLKFRGGHIAYYVRPSERKKGCATKMLTLALEYCKNLNIDRVLITCSKENTYSARTIQKNCGILHSKDVENGQTFQRYWIDI